MTRKFFLATLLVIVSLVSLPSISFAQSRPTLMESTPPSEGSGVAPQPDTQMIYPQPPISSYGFLGQSHFYSVVFRGNGEAVVSLRVALANTGDSDLSEVTLNIPRAIPNGLIAYQVLREPICVRYRQQNNGNGVGLVPQSTKVLESVCEEYQDPDYYNQYYGDSQYQKAQVFVSSETVRIVLPQSIAAGKEGSFFVYFRGMGYVKKNVFGAYTYTFETAKVTDNIQNIQIGISTDSDLVLKGATGEVSYRGNELMGHDLAQFAEVTPAKSNTLDQFVSQIGQGRITKTASSLAPSESYTVEGIYASSRLSLYGKEFVIGLVVLLGLLVIIVIVAKLIIKGMSPVAKRSENASANSKMISMIVVSGFVSATLIAFYTGLLVFGGNFFIGNWFTFINSEYVSGIWILGIVISICIYAVLFFAPAIYFALKKGIGWGVAEALSTIVWLILILGIFVFGLFVFGKTVPQTIPPVIMGRDQQTLQSPEIMPR